MAFSLKTLFTSKKAQPTPATLPVVGQQQPPVNANDRRQGETYQNWGMRMCATVGGSNFALVPMLQKAYQDEYNAQAQNVQLQQQTRANLQAQVEQEKNNKQLLQQQIEQANQKINDNNTAIDRAKEAINRLKEEKETKNKDEWVKFWIALAILIPLTFYLLLFYSSTFFSAFIDGSGVSDATKAMFNPQAFSKTWDKSVVSFLLMICFPIIFMGLGFNLHYFLKENGKAKYVKTLAVLCVTFIFDCILAYKIGEKIHDAMVLNALVQDGPYTISLAIRDISFWAVIFCGFVSYIIWGLVFNQLMEAYSKLDLNKVRILQLSTEIDDLKADNGKQQQNIANYQAQQTAIDNAITTLMAQLANTVNIDYGLIRQSMTNFFTGWITQMGVLGCSQQAQATANATFNNTVNTLTPNNKVNTLTPNNN
ncbi:MAG: hypothetical protein IJT30_11355 [Muribaculaceae bacterium]|nr:hypothetical protein [Muribaculaceae bacterium]